MATYAYIDRRTGGVHHTVDAEARPMLTEEEAALYELRAVADDVEAGMRPGDHADLGNLALLLQAQEAGTR